VCFQDYKFWGEGGTLWHKQWGFGSECEFCVYEGEEK